MPSNHQSNPPGASPNARRRLLRTLAAGGGVAVAGKTLPRTWERPAIDSVLLPAHAQATGAFAGASSGTEGSLPNGLGARILDRLVPGATAEEIDNGLIEIPDISWMAYMCAETRPDGSGLTTFNVVIERTIANGSACHDRVRFTGTDIPTSTTTLLDRQGSDCFAGSFDLDFVDAEPPSPIPFVRDAVAINGSGSSSQLQLTLNSIGTSILGQLVLTIPFGLIVLQSEVSMRTRALDLFVPRSEANDVQATILFPVDLSVGACNQPSTGCGDCKILIVL